MGLRPILETVVEGLSLDQQRAALSQARFIRVVAGAGAGKTETLTRRILVLLARGAQPEDIVAFTFTERAAAAMKERIYRRATEYLGLETGQKLGSMFVGTIHSYCARLLQDHFGYGNWDVLDEDQEIAFLLQHGWELDVRLDPNESPLAFPPRSNYAKRCLLFKHSEAVVAHEMLNLDLLKRHGSTTAAFADNVERYWTILDRHHLLTFDRLVRLAVEHLSQNPGRAYCRHLIVDEYQDLNRAQEQLVSLLWPGIGSRAVSWWATRGSASTNGGALTQHVSTVSPRQAVKSTNWWSTGAADHVSSRRQTLSPVTSGAAPTCRSRCCPPDTKATTS